MARLTATDKWEQRWFRRLTPKQKCIWIFLCERCDNAGVWQPDFDLMSFFIGDECTADDIELINAEKQRIITLDSGKLFVRDHVLFQWGDRISSNSNIRVNISRLFNKHGITSDMLPHGVKGYFSKLLGSGRGVTGESLGSDMGVTGKSLGNDLPMTLDIDIGKDIDIEKNVKSNHIDTVQIQNVLNQYDTDRKAFVDEQYKIMQGIFPAQKQKAMLHRMLRDNHAISQQEIDEAEKRFREKQKKAINSGEAERVVNEQPVLVEQVTTAEEIEHDNEIPF